MTSNSSPPIFQLPTGTPRPKRRLLIALLGIIGLLVIILVQVAFPLQQRGTSSQSEGTFDANPAQLPVSSLGHFIGGFNIESKAEIANAAANGIQATLIYGYTPGETNDSIGETLKANDIKVIDAIPWRYLHYYACHKNNT